MKKLFFILIFCFATQGFACIADECKDKTKDECLNYLYKKCDENSCMYCQSLIASLNASFISTKNMVGNFEIKKEKARKLKKLKKEIKDIYKEKKEICPNLRIFIDLK